MKKLRIVIDDKIPYIRGEAEKLGETVYLPGAEIAAADVRDADALIVRTRTRCDRALLEGSRVKFVATATIGFDHLDTDYLQSAGIGWENCPGCNAGSVAQYVVSAMLVLASEGVWGMPRPQTAGAQSLFGSLGRLPLTGIVGVGNVGLQVAAALRRLGLPVLLCDPPRVAAGNFPDGLSAADFVTQDVVERNADVVTLHVPLTMSGPYATMHLADDAFFGRLARKPVFINTGRGETVCTSALRKALSAGSVHHAVIDTWENEPHIDRSLLHETFIGTPHIAGYSADGKANGTRMALEAVARRFGLSATFDISPPPLPDDFRYDPQTASDIACRLPQLRLYDPRRDSRALKAHPERFERLRGDYPLRREPLAAAGTACAQSR